MPRSGQKKRFRCAVLLFLKLGTATSLFCQVQACPTIRKQTFFCAAPFEPQLLLVCRTLPDTERIRMTRLRCPTQNVRLVVGSGCAQSWNSLVPLFKAITLCSAANRGACSIAQLPDLRVSLSLRVGQPSTASSVFWCSTNNDSCECRNFYRVHWCGFFHCNSDPGTVRDAST